MGKTVIKEMIIMLLLALVIILLLGILLYEYVPMTKTMPNPVSYITPENVRQELADTEDLDESQIIMTYEVDATDLNNYTRIQDYKPGKANPFSSYETTETNAMGTTTANSSTGESGTTTSSSTSNSTNSGTTNTGSSNSESTNIGNSNTESSQTTDNKSSQTDTKEDKSSTSGGYFFQDKGTK